MDPVQTLHDFTLTLLTDPTTRSAFQSDPQATLQGAGLGDLSPLDVREVLPLVLDYAPSSGLGDLDSTLSGVSLDEALDLIGAGSVDLGRDALGQGVDDNSATAALSGVAAAAHHLTGDLGVDLVDDLDADVLNTVHDLSAGTGVTDIVDTEVLDTARVTDVVGDVTTLHTGDLGVDDVLSGDVTDIADITGITDSTTGLHDIAQTGDVLSDIVHFGDVADIGDVTTKVGDIANVGSITDVSDALGHVDLGGVLNDNDIAF
ncbi:IniB N-terminal domain-containing protein [Saccharothrix lopnurensis]|uniref:IniB N-terminal domain-containing protein n=1 Tax=Saccharothrix lopnurensis TaxID=1670621 RepID=A0ABW1PD63_9PSEU